MRSLCDGLESEKKYAKGIMVWKLKELERGLVFIQSNDGPRQTQNNAKKKKKINVVSIR